MSIFPVKKTKKGYLFKLRIDDVCSLERSISNGGWLPSVGFTEMTPCNMDNIGGLPSTLESSAKTICFRGDGCVFTQSEDTNLAEKDSSMKEVARAEPAFPHVLEPEDSLEYLWGSGLIECCVNGEILYRVKNKDIPRPPKKPMYALVDCCHATCKATLVV